MNVMLYDIRSYFTQGKTILLCFEHFPFYIFSLWQNPTTLVTQKINNRQCVISKKGHAYRFMKYYPGGHFYCASYTIAGSAVG